MSFSRQIVICCRWAEVKKALHIMTIKVWSFDFLLTSEKVGMH